MQLDERKRRLIVLGIAALFLLMGAIQGIFKIKLNQKIMDEVSFVLMMIAAWLLLSGRKPAKSAKSDAQEQTDSNPELSDNSSENLKPKDETKP